MQRFRIDLSYNGRDFCGWQRQPNAPSVQEYIEDALSKLHSHQTIDVVGCGRTDTGVHAYHYVLHVDLPENTDAEQLCFKLNRMLPPSIVIESAILCDPDFHARFGATLRTYRYFIHHTKDAFHHEQSWYIPQELDYNAMNHAASMFLGTQDFTSLAKLHTDVKTNICTVESAKWIRQNESESYFEISADRFLRNMVRASVGTLVDVGLGKIKPDEIPAILAAKDRQAASTSVPAHGLFLWRVEY